MKAMLWLGLSGLLALGGCASMLPPSFPTGTSMSEVQARMGPLRGVAKAPNGETVWQYPTGPAGQFTYMVTFGPDQRSTSVFQALTIERFAKIQRGMTRDDIRLMFGQPAETMFFWRMDEEVWSYHYRPSATYGRIFNVHFDAKSGLVRNTSEQDDPLVNPINWGGSTI